MRIFFPFLFKSGYKILFVFLGPHEACSHLQSPAHLRTPKQVMSRKRRACSHSHSPAHAVREWVLPHLCFIWMHPVTHMIESCHTYAIHGSHAHTWMSHVTHEWDMSHMIESRHIYRYGTRWQMWLTCTHVNESCHAWTSHVTLNLVMSHMNESCHRYTCVYYICAGMERGGRCGSLAHTWMSHATHEWVMSHLVMSHMNESCHRYVTRTWAMSHMIESCHTYRYGTRCQTCLTCTHMNESCHTWMSITHDWVMSHI